MTLDIHNLPPDEKAKARASYIQTDFPYSVSLSLGEFNCNQRCRMCPMFSGPPSEERTMRQDVFEAICDNVGSRDVSFEISAYGETFQHPQTDEFLGIARKKAPNATIIVATNGSKLNERRCEAIVDSGIDVLQFSLDAGSAESHQWLTGAKHYDALCRNLERLAETKAKRKADHLKIQTHIMGIKELAHEFDSFVDHWSSIVDFAYVRNYGNWAGLVDDNGITPAEKQVIPEERYPCAWLWYASKIGPTGEVSKCFIHSVSGQEPVGNVLDAPLEEIWRGEPLERLRRLHCENDFESMQYCKDCIVWSLFPKFWEKSEENGISRWR